jgi:hypothetical protein
VSVIHFCVAGEAEITLMVPAFESVMNIVPAEFTSISIPVMGLITDVPAGSPHLLMNSVSSDRRDVDHDCLIIYSEVNKDFCLNPSNQISTNTEYTARSVQLALLFFP